LAFSPLTLHATAETENAREPDAIGAAAARSEMRPDIVVGVVVAVPLRAMDFAPEVGGRRWDELGIKCKLNAAN
jgi:hypothetical protein